MSKSIKLTVWYAVDKDGVSGFYSQMPYRDKLSDSWNTNGEYYVPEDDLFQGVELPEGLTWDNEPVEYELEITITKKS